MSGIEGLGKVEGIIIGSSVQGSGVEGGGGSPPPPGTFLTDDSGVVLTDDSGANRITTS